MLLFNLFLSLIVVGQINQSITFSKSVMYKVSFIKDTINNTLKEDITELLYNDSLSVFSSMNKYVIDSVKQINHNKNNKSLDLSFVTRYPTELSFTIISSFDSIYTYDLIGYSLGERFRYIESLEDIEWELINETKTIMGLVCQRAETQYGGRKWTAWFSESVPITLGPYKFRNLPGLIIELEDHSHTWKFECIGLNNDVDRQIFIKKGSYLHDSHILTTRNEFLEKKNYVRDNSFFIFMSEQKTIENNLNNEVRNKIKKRLDDISKGDNNWIELYP